LERDYGGTVRQLGTNLKGEVSNNAPAAETTDPPFDTAIEQFT
jgi:hypothetical protein